MYDDLAEDIPHRAAVFAHGKLSESLEPGKVPKQPSRKMLIMWLFHGFAERLVAMDEEGASRVIDSLKSYLQNCDSKNNAMRKPHSCLAYHPFQVKRTCPPCRHVSHPACPHLPTTARREPGSQGRGA
ncbi:hypothetical protein CC80DRAFT_329934 [Byssothecium circinans]|uniref:Uncharacterized protein n=1 Tax=Byssothecium circinans TaxID=147558 RepID=A0A6A5T7N9_9PLEO|nr:hypothetical protein CC80DRAFT_329934 [Byssothecium circinans]